MPVRFNEIIDIYQEFHQEDKEQVVNSAAELDKFFVWFVSLATATVAFLITYSEKVGIRPDFLAATVILLFIAIWFSIMGRTINFFYKDLSLKEYGEFRKNLAYRRLARLPIIDKGFPASFYINGIIAYYEKQGDWFNAEAIKIVYNSEDGATLSSDEAFEVYEEIRNEEKTKMSFFADDLQVELDAIQGLPTDRMSKEEIDQIEEVDFSERLPELGERKIKVGKTLLTLEQSVRWLYLIALACFIFSLGTLVIGFVIKMEKLL